jgi:hypothetical protein
MKLFSKQAQDTARKKVFHTIYIEIDGLNFYTAHKGRHTLASK